MHEEIQQTLAYTNGILSMKATSEDLTARQVLITQKFKQLQGMYS